MNIKHDPEEQKPEETTATPATPQSDTEETIIDLSFGRTPASEGVFDFKAQAGLSADFPDSYLRQYYGVERPVTDDETAVYDFIRERVAPQLTGHESCLEIGCGPTVHHAIMLSPHIGSLTMSDYLEGNLQRVESWRHNTSQAWNWNRYTAFFIERDGEVASEDAVSAREELTRSKLIETRPINILERHPLGRADLTYDVVSTFYCTEEVALNVARWQEAMVAVTSLVNPGGHLLMSCLYDSDFYHILGEDSSVRTLPCARITEETLSKTLEDLGFVITPESIKLVQTPEQEAEGVPGVLLVFAQKRLATDALT